MKAHLIVTNLSKSYLERSKLTVASILSNLISKNTRNKFVIPNSNQISPSLKNITFAVKKGETIGIIGFNGSGKTTLLRTLNEQLTVNSGQVIKSSEVGALIDLTTGFSDNLNGIENIKKKAFSLGIKKQFLDNKIQSIVNFSDLGKYIYRKYGTYSSGMKLRLAMSILLNLDYKILLIDEVISVGDFAFRQKCLQKFRKIREYTAIVFVSHSLNDIKQFCNKTIVLSGGEIKYFGDNETAIKIYLNSENQNFSNKEKLRKNILSPQFFNETEVKSLNSMWVNSAGKETESFEFKESINLKLNVNFFSKPRNLIVGIPIWNSDGVLVTGLTTPRDGKGLPIGDDLKISLQFTLDHSILSPGIYYANVAIHDGIEYLARLETNNFEITNERQIDYWGVCTPPYNWKKTN